MNTIESENAKLLCDVALLENAAEGRFADLADKIEEIRVLK